MNIPLDKNNVFGSPASQIFFNKSKFSFKLERNLMLNDLELENSFDVIKKLFSLIIGAFKIEAVFLYKELVDIFENQNIIFEENGLFKNDLPYS